MNKKMFFASFLALSLCFSSCNNSNKSNVNKSYKISLTELDGATVNIDKLTYKVGELVEFSVNCTKEKYVLAVTDGGLYVEQYEDLGNDHYSFTMPARDLIIGVQGYNPPSPSTYSVNVVSDDDIEVVLLKNSFEAGETVNFSIIYSGEYLISIFKAVGGVITYSGTHPDYSFIMPEANVTINIKKKVPHSITVNADDDISVTGLSTQYYFGDTVSFTVVATEEYTISIIGSSEISYSGSNPYTFVMPEANVIINVTKKGDDPLKNKLTFDQRYQPIWDDGGVIYNEQVMLHAHEDGTVYGELLYTPDNVIEVKDYLMTKIFQKDIDFEIIGRKIIVKNAISSQMPYLTLDQYNAVSSSLEETGISTLNSDKSPTGKVLWSEHPHIVKFTILVTYSHSDAWYGNKMYKQGNLLPKTLNKLKNGNNFNLAVYGDSNATGAVTSGYWVEDYEGTHPGASTLFHGDYDLQEPFTKGFKTALEHKYGVNCNLYNPSEGGKDSSWMNLYPDAGSKNLWTGNAYDASKTRIQNWLSDMVPDLVVFVFGNNDISFGVDADTFVNNLVKAIQTVLSANPNAEFIVSLPKRSNPLAQQDNPTGTQNILNAVKFSIKDTSGFAFHDMTTLTSDLLQRKDAYSLFGNGINHSNDFLARQWVSLFLNCLEIPETGEEWNYDNDPTVVHSSTDYAKDWQQVVSDSVEVNTPINLNDGVELPSLSTWGEGYARKEKVYLDGLEFDFKGNNMKYGGDVPYNDLPNYLLSTAIGFFFSKNVGNWTGSTAYPFNGFAFNLIDIYGQNRVFVGQSNDYNSGTIMYLDSNCTQPFTSNGTNQMIFNRLSNGDYTDHAGVKVSFNKVNEGVYSIKITALYSNYMWENNPNYSSSDKSCTYYIKAQSFANVLNEDGSTYINVFGYGPEYQGSGYGGDMSASVINLFTKEPSPVAKGDLIKNYSLDSGEAVRFYYDPVIDKSTPMGLERSKDNVNFEQIDIAHRVFDVDNNGYYAEITFDGLKYIANIAGKGSYYIKLKCSNGYCQWTLIIK